MNKGCGKKIISPDIHCGEECYLCDEIHYCKECRNCETKGEKQE